MNRIMRILVGLGLIAYGIYSGNVWFYLGAILLITGLANWCPMEKMMGKCSSGNCGTTTKEEESSCCSSDNTEELSCCSNSTKQAQFTTTPSQEQISCCSKESNKTVIKILGITQCTNCTALKKVVDEAVKNIDGNFEVIKVEDEQEIMKYQVMSTPGLVINGVVKSVGKFLNIEEVTALINGAGVQKGKEITSKCCGN